MILSNNIKVYCSNVGITEQRFEVLCGLPNGIVGKWRKGQHTNTTLRTVEKIAEATKIPAAKWITEGGIREKRRKKNV